LIHAWIDIQGRGRPQAGSEVALSETEQWSSVFLGC
jgi:hypothetical protein